MLENAAAIVVYSHESLVAWENLDEDRSVARDYAWMLSLDLVRGTESTWRSFRDGYAAGGEIGRSRYGRRRHLSQAMEL
jgi:hypothetical protein